METGTVADRARFRRIALAGIAWLAFMEGVIAVIASYLGFTWLVVAMLIGMPMLAVYLAYLIRRFAKPSSRR